MPYAIHKDHPRSLITVYFWGEVTDEVLHEYISELPKLGLTEEPSDLLLVVDEETQINVKTDLIRNGAKREQAFHSDTRRIIVANRELAFGLSRIYFAEAGGSEEKEFLFYRLDDAANVLGVELSGLVTLLAELRRANP